MDYISIFNLIINQLSNRVNNLAFLLSYRYPNHFVRSGGKLTIRHIVLYLINCSRQAMHTNISSIRDIAPIEFPKVTKQAVSKARQGIMPSLFCSMFNLTVKSFYENIGSNKILWRDRFSVFAIDGMRLQLPNSRSNLEKFGSLFTKDDPDRRWSMALASTIYDVCNDYIAHAIIQPYTSSERDAAKEHFRKLDSLNILEGSVIIFDRGYYSEDMFRHFSSQNHMCVMRLRESFRLSKDCTGDTIAILPGDPKKGTEDIKVRVISIDLGNGITEYLATNIFDDDFTAEDFKELYFLRWKIEGKYYELKTTFRIEAFNGATSTSIEQEFFITLMFSNLTALVKADADKKIEENARPDNKYDYQANRSHIAGRLKKILAIILVKKKHKERLPLILDLFESASMNKSQVQPGRNDPRKRKNNEWKYYVNRKTAV